MYFAAQQQFIKTLTNLDKILEKAVQHANAKQFDPDVFINTRLYPDMLPFARQITIACDAAKTACATFAGKPAPRFEDNEKTMVELQERIRKTKAFITDFTDKDFTGVDTKKLYAVAYPQGKAMYPEDILFTRSVPNFFFHVTMAYAILRQGGVEIGKMDYLGDLRMFEAP